MSPEHERQRRRQDTPRIGHDSNGYAAVGRRQVKVLGALTGLLLGVVGGTAGAVYKVGQDEIARVRADAVREREEIRQDADEKLDTIMRLCGMEP